MESAIFRPTISHFYEQENCSGTLIYSVDDCEPLCLPFIANIRIKILLDADQKRLDRCEFVDEKTSSEIAVNSSTTDIEMKSTTSPEGQEKVEIKSSDCEFPHQSKTSHLVSMQIPGDSAQSDEEICFVYEDDPDNDIPCSRAEKWGPFMKNNETDVSKPKPSISKASNLPSQRALKLKKRNSRLISSQQNSLSDTSEFGISHSKFKHYKQQLPVKSSLTSTNKRSKNGKNNSCGSSQSRKSSHASINDQSRPLSLVTGSKLEEESDSLDQGEEDEDEIGNMNRAPIVSKPKRKRPPKPGKLTLVKNVKCFHCEVTFDTKLDFFNHRLSKGADFQCKICGKVKRFESLLFIHMLSHEPHKGYVCHDKDYKKRTGEMKCSICGMVVSSLDTLKVHMNEHSGEKPYQCCVCEDQQFVSLSALTAHHKRVHRKSERFQCKLCDSGFSTRGELSKHKLTHEVKCGLCEEVFPNITLRTCHYRISHPHDIKKCCECSLMFSTDEELEKHARYHRLRKKEQCPECGKMVTRLKAHMAVHSRIDGAEDFFCDQCPAKFFTKANLERHLLVHSGERSYSCDKCPKKFSSAGRLRKHLFTHTLEHPYVCEICGKKCSFHYNLMTHMRIHSKIKKYHCILCPQSFHHKSSLQNHMKSKHGDAPDPVDFAEVSESESIQMSPNIED